jgi:transcriptional regulator with XRE-family HTH domain
MVKDADDPVMKKVRALFEKSGKSLDALGQEMGHDGPTARKAAWQFLNKVGDPRISTLRRFAKAVGVPVKDLL